MSLICPRKSVKPQLRPLPRKNGRAPRLKPIRSRALADAERLLIARVLKVTGGNQSDAARLLDIERHRLHRKILHHGLEHLAHIRPR